MRRPILTLVLALFLVHSSTAYGQRGFGGRGFGHSGGHARSGSVSVKGHFRRDGTYVSPHFRSAPDGNSFNNWSTRGNINPFTGKNGTRTLPAIDQGLPHSLVSPDGRVRVSKSHSSSDSLDPSPLVPATPSIPDLSSHHSTKSFFGVTTVPRTSIIDLRKVRPSNNAIISLPSFTGRSNACLTCPREQNGKIKRSSSARREFIRLHPCPSTGKSSGPCPGYVVDHIRPLSIGGADDPSNMQWQTRAAAKAKDRIERR